MVFERAREQTINFAKPYRVGSKAIQLEVRKKSKKKNKKRRKRNLRSRRLALKKRKEE